MDYKKNHFRQVLLYYFFRKKSAAQATRELRQVYGDEALKERQCRNWFTRFRAGDYSLRDEPHTGRPHEVVDDEIMALIDADPHISIREIGDKLQVHFSTIDRHLQRLGYVKEHNLWVSKETEFVSATQAQRIEDHNKIRKDPLVDSNSIQINCDVSMTGGITNKGKSSETYSNDAFPESPIKDCGKVYSYGKLENKGKDSGGIKKKKLQTRKK